MSEIDLKQLVKILNLTQSDSDGEALSAIRKVNSILKKNNKEWKDMIIYAPVPQEQHYRWEKCPELFDSDFFKAITLCKEFIRTLNADQIEVVNNYIRFYNQSKFLPHKNWTDLRKVWHNFREENR